MRSAFWLGITLILGIGTPARAAREQLSFYPTTVSIVDDRLDLMASVVHSSDDRRGTTLVLESPDFRVPRRTYSSREIFKEARRFFALHVRRLDSQIVVVGLTDDEPADAFIAFFTPSGEPNGVAVFSTDKLFRWGGAGSGHFQSPLVVGQSVRHGSLVIGLHGESRELVLFHFDISNYRPVIAFGQWGKAHIVLPSTNFRIDGIFEYDLGDLFIVGSEVLSKDERVKPGELKFLRTDEKGTPIGGWTTLAARDHGYTFLQGFDKETLETGGFELIPKAGGNTQKRISLRLYPLEMTSSEGKLWETRISYEGENGTVQFAGSVSRGQGLYQFKQAHPECAALVEKRLIQPWLRGPR